MTTKFLNIHTHPEMNNFSQHSTEAKSAVINCFLLCNDLAATQNTVQQIRQSALVKAIYLLVNDSNTQIDGCESLLIDSIQSSATIALIAAKSDADYSLIYTKDSELEHGQFVMERFN